MKIISQQIIYTVSLILCLNLAHAQRITEFGLNAGTARFYPEARYFDNYHNGNNSVDNGFGWSSGVFLENYWNPKFRQVIEINYYNFSSDIYLQKDPAGPWSPYDGTGRQPVIGNFRNEPYHFLSFSVGIKYFLNKRLFVYPGFELARSLNPRVDLNTIIYYAKSWEPLYIRTYNKGNISCNAKLGVGVDLKVADILLEYSYGLNYQLSFFEYSTPLGLTQRNNYLQLKVQVPLLRLK